MQIKKVVVTGIGTINPLGNSITDYFANLDKGVSGATLIDRFDTTFFKTRFACQVRDFTPEMAGLDRKEARKNDLFTQFALAAAEQAVNDSGLDFSSLDQSRTGVIIGSGIGGIETLTDDMLEYKAGETPRFSPFLCTKMITNMAAGMVSIKYGLKGASFSVSSACASSSHAIVTAIQQIQLGLQDVMISGGSEAPITIPSIGGFSSSHALSTNNDEYQTASRPFDKNRDGFVMGEGAGILILEEYEHAIKRGAKIYAEIAGYGLSSDAYHITAPHPEGEGAKAAMLSAIESAGLSLTDIDYINAHGTSTHRGDVAELSAIKSLFGERTKDINISATKSMTGHLLGAAGAIEAIATIHAIQDGIIPPTINFTTQDEEIDYDSFNLTLNHAQQRDVNVAISNNFGFGGHNCCIVFRKI